MKITFRIWVWIIIVLFSVISIFSIPPVFLEKGVVVSSISQNSSLFEGGLRKGAIITQVNSAPINSIDDFYKEISYLSSASKEEPLKLTIDTKDTRIVNVYDYDISSDVRVSLIAPTNIKTGLDLQGGARALVQADVPLSEQDVSDLIAVSEARLNVYGLSDLHLFKVLTSDQQLMMGVEIAGSTPQDLETLIEQQGSFEAKIGNETVFIGGNKDITHVGRSGQDAIITECFAVQQGLEACNFRFGIFLSEEAAQRHADITDKLTYNGSYLSKTLDLYLDGVLIDSLRIGASLKGSVATQISISGSGQGSTRQEAIDTARAEMKELQTVLITGSLPFKLEIVKLDRISPRLGGQFIHQLLLAGAFALLSVSIVVYARYRKIKISLALIAVSFSEVIIILGVAALINWNLNLPSIAGIVAAIGTGIDSQIIILDESRDRKESLKDRIKKALFIIVTAFTTTFVALIPLTGFLSFMGIGAASAGLLKGFAVTTLIGITSGVLITRPAFADMARQLEKE